MNGGKVSPKKLSQCTNDLTLARQESRGSATLNPEVGKNLFKYFDTVSNELTAARTFGNVYPAVKNLTYQDRLALAARVEQRVEIMLGDKAAKASSIEKRQAMAKGSIHYLNEWDMHECAAVLFRRDQKP